MLISFHHIREENSYPTFEHSIKSMCFHIYFVSYQSIDIFLAVMGRPKKERPKRYKSYLRAFEEAQDEAPEIPESTLRSQRKRKQLEDLTWSSSSSDQVKLILGKYLSYFLLKLPLTLAMCNRMNWHKLNKLKQKLTHHQNPQMRTMKGSNSIK